MKDIGFSPADILLPREDIDMERWAVVACDQYTSEKEYWSDADRIVGDAPSTLRMILPECYLEESGKEDKQQEAYYFKEVVLPLMEDLRVDCDLLETFVAKEFWKFPTYGDILYYK